MFLRQPMFLRQRWFLRQPMFHRQRRLMQELGLQQFEKRWFLQQQQPIFHLGGVQPIFLGEDIQLFVQLFLVGHNQHIYQYRYMEYFQSNIQLERIQFISFRVGYKRSFRRCHIE